MSVFCPYPKYLLEPRKRGNSRGTRILPEGAYVTHNRERGILNLHIDRELVLQMCFSPQESEVLALLLEAYPDIAYYEEIRAVAKGEDKEESATIVGHAIDSNYSTEALRPVRNIIYRIRAKLVLFNIEPFVTGALGYSLYPVDPASEYLEVLKQRIDKALSKRKQ